MRISRQHRRNARLLWQAVCVNERPDADRIRIVLRDIKQCEGRGAEAVLRCFMTRLNIYIRANRIGVTSADPLSAQQREQILDAFVGTDSAKAGITFSVDPAVIGGLRLERGHQVTDLTIARQLEIVQDKLLGK